ncbi:WhiB family transcriptional regulator [Mycolicibacterium boenickei]|nr:WhiB family transcriptional regulator [Mycolicibacterium boenickei]
MTIIGAAALGIVNRESWQAKGACRNHKTPDIWYPHKKSPPDQTIEARSICIGCEVREKCLQYAMDHPDERGIWGGLTELERAGILKGRKVNTFAKCHECSTEFVKQGGWHRYCSDECRKTNERRRNREYATRRRNQGGAA